MRGGSASAAGFRCPIPLATQFNEQITLLTIACMAIEEIF